MSRKRSILIAALACVLAVPASVLGIAFFLAQRADYGWRPAVAAPEFTDAHPLVLFDEGHNNASSAGFTGRYWPFARLLRADGYAVTRGRAAVTAASLAGAKVLVIANASGAPKPQIFGINIPIPTARKRGDPAFTADEIGVIRSWVEQGGALLLIADHAPFGAAVSDLSAAFGVTMHKGFAEVPGEVSDPLLFSKENGRLGDHPIVRGGRPGAAVRRVMTYTGQSLDASEGASVLLRLPPSAVEAVPEGDGLVERPAGPAQGIALEVGKGRVVVLGEGAMATAQVNRLEPYGMNTGDNDNAQFMLNVMHWLSRRLP
jgi:hypothetical protein